MEPNILDVITMIVMVFCLMAVLLLIVPLRLFRASEDDRRLTFVEWLSTKSPQYKQAMIETGEQRRDAEATLTRAGQQHAEAEAILAEYKAHRASIEAQDKDDSDDHEDNEDTVTK